MNTQQTEARQRLLVIGGGPVGIEFALAMIKSNKWDVTILEKGGPLQNVREWGFVRLFSPNALNTTEIGLQVLDELKIPRPDEAVFPTGDELVETYFSHLWGYIEKHANVFSHTRVVSVGRGPTRLKGDMTSRKGIPFQVLVEDQTGQERIIVGDAVIDASGSFGQRNWLGPGGLPALGERKCFADIVPVIPNISKEESKYLNKSTLVVGSGYSAITTIHHLKALSEANPNSAEKTKVVWVTRRAGEIYNRVEGDPLPQRDALSVFGNTLSSDGENNFEVEKHECSVVSSIVKQGGESGSKFKVTLQTVSMEGQTDAKREEEEVAVLVDNVIANVGYRPDTSIYQELQVHQCYATEGPMKLAAAMMAAQGNGGDCLQQVAPGPSTLVSPEPNFFIIGIKSYGRGSAFLLKIGHAQIDMVIELLNGATA